MAITAAFGGLLASIAAAVVVDGAAAALYARRLQGAADLAALAAARDLVRAQAAAEATVGANLDRPATVVARSGVYTARRDIPARERFRAGGLDAANAAEVEVTSSAPLWFSGLLNGGRDIRMTRTGRAALPGGDPMAMFSLGSRLAALDGGLANQLLSGLTGSSVSLSVADYRGLVSARANLLDFTDQLATELSITAGDYDALLRREMDAGRLLRVIASTTDGADASLSHLAKAMDGRRLRLGDLIGLEAGAPQGLRGALDAEIAVADLIMAVLEIASPDRQVRLKAPVNTGLAQIDLWLAIGERPNRSPWLAVARDGDIVVRTAQARLLVRAKTTDSLAAVGRLDLPVLVEVADAEARLSAIQCTPNRRVEVHARPGVGRLRVMDVDPARLDDFKSPLADRPAILADVAGIARITARADLNLRSSTETRLVFDGDDIDAGRTKTARSAGFAIAPTARLLETMQVTVQAAGLTLNAAGATGAVSSILRAVSPALDGVIDDTLNLFGLSLGEADVVVPAVSCPRAGAAPVLVG